MDRDQRNITLTAIGRAALAALLLAGGAQIQAQTPGSVQDFQLPPKPAPSRAPAEGPVDTDHPVAAPTAPAPAPSAAPQPSASPAIVLPAPVASEPARLRPAARPAPQPSQQAAPVPQASETLPPLPSEAPPIEAAPVPSQAPAPVAAAPDGLPWWWIGAGLIGLLAIAAFFLRRRSEPAETEPVPVAEPSSAASAPAALTPLAKLPAKAAPPPPPPPVAQPAPAIDGALQIALDPRSVRFSFVYATLSYAIELTNRTGSPLRALRISADLTSGHASLPIEQQLALNGEELPPRHEAAVLDSGESIVFSGELQLPLAEVVALRAGNAALFVPLARFRIESGTLRETHIFTLGLPSDRPGGSMQPFRLDLGPQLFRPVEQRPVDLSPWLDLDAPVRAG